MHWTRNDSFFFFKGERDWKHGDTRARAAMNVKDILKSASARNAGHFFQYVDRNPTFAFVISLLVTIHSVGVFGFEDF